MLIEFLLVGIGGALGSMARLGLVKVLPAEIFQIPLPILAVNILGCFLMGFLSQFLNHFGHFSENARQFLGVGFLGGFTTFSAFALQTGALYEKKQIVVACLYIVLSVLLSLLGFFIGIKLYKLF